MSSSMHGGGLASQKRIAVGMSGGLYSAVAASLLKSQGYSIQGIHLVFAGAQSKSRLGKLKPNCVSEAPASLQQAQAHCKKLGIPLEVIDLDAAFDEKWIDGFLHEILKSGTPNPCRVCRGDLLVSGLLSAAAKILGRPDATVATGHAVRVTDDLHSGERVLQIGTDSSRDQSYWLARISSLDLKRMSFPVGDLSVKLLERLAAESGITVPKASGRSGAEQPCVSRSPDVLSWVEAMTPASLRRSGAIRTPGGSGMGAHDGLFRHTLGQKLQSAEQSPEKQDVFVIGMDRMKNLIVVGNASPMVSSRWLLKNALWRRSKVPAAGAVLQFRQYSRGELYEGKVTAYESGGLKLEILPSNRALAGVQGQFLVFYEGDEVVVSAELDQPLSGA
jgi:tRNA-specific 2-thiouridylase